MLECDEVRSTGQEEAVACCNTLYLGLWRRMEENTKANILGLVSYRGALWQCQPVITIALSIRRTFQHDCNFVGW